VKVYTDGACSNNPGPGGWGAVFTGQEELKVLSGFRPKTTNNKMELKAVVEAMKYIVNNKSDFEDVDVEIYSDSAYVVNAINNKWIDTWKVNKWRTSKGSIVKNKSLWESFIRYSEQIKELGIKYIIIKVKGHSGDTYNEYVDGVAKNEVNNARLYIATKIGGDM